MSNPEVQEMIQTDAVTDVIESTSTPEQREEAKSIVEILITKNKTIVFGKSFCPYTKKAIDLFISLAIPYESLMLDLFEEGKYIQDYLFEKTLAKGVPRIFINGKHIGGASDLSELHESDKLQTLYDSFPTNHSSLIDLVGEVLPDIPDELPPVIDNVDPESETESILEPIPTPEIIVITEQKEEAKSMVENLIAQNETVIFGKSICVYTQKAIDLFASLEIPTESLMLDTIENGKFIQDYLFEKTLEKGVPRIFVNNHHIGGATDALSLHDQNKLSALYRPFEVENTSSLVGLVDVLSHKNSVNSVKIDALTVAVGEAVVTKSELLPIRERRGSFAEYQPETPENIVIASLIVESFEESTEDVISDVTAAPVEPISKGMEMERVEPTPFVRCATISPANYGEIILYDHLLAYYPSRARLVLNEKGIPYTHKLIDIFNGESLQPDFIRLTIKGQPCGALPVLQQNNLIITESKELCEYVDSIESTPSSGPLGGSISQKEVQKWVNLIHPWNGNVYMAGKVTGGAKSLMSGLNHFKIKYCLARALENPDLREIYEQKAKSLEYVCSETEYLQNQMQLEEILDKIEKQLMETKYVCGGEYTLADVFLTCMVYRGLTAGTDLFQSRPKLKIWYNVIQARPSFQKTFKDARVQRHPALAVVGALAPALVCKLTGRC
jgi:glutathione S-transferase/glutaredoxin